MFSLATIRTASLAVALSAAATVAFAATASAATYKSKRLDHGAAHATQKYEAGRRSGRITYLEGLRVRRVMRQYDALKSAYSADGRLTPYERRALRQKLAEVKSTVQSASHNGYRRLGGLPRVGR